MKRKYIYYLIILLLLIIGTYWIVNSSSTKTDGTYQFAEIVRGNLKSVITASGTLSPLTIVDVGTQTSGTIDSVYVDYNERVTFGQILAVLDTVLLKATVVDAEASVDRAKALMEQAEYNYDLYKKLFDRGMISDADLLPYSIELKTQGASIKSAEAALIRAQRNLDYAVIRSPINGTVIDRSIEGGQTVAASFSTPTLFQIAEDLSRMEILVDVDESDIGQIKEGQRVEFEVQTYSDVSFEGVVRQVRLQPTTVSNVVTYTVVVEAENKNDLLLPGMTATVDFIIEEKNDILLVSNKALRYQPSDEVKQKLFEQMKAQRGNQPERPNRPPDSTGSGGMAGGGDAPSSKNSGMVWLVGDDGQLRMEPIRIGMTDGSNTEIVKSRDLAEGSKVIVGTGSNGTKSASSSGNMQRGFGPPPGF